MPKSCGPLSFSGIGADSKFAVSGLNPVVDLEYRFSGTQNNGRVTSVKDWVSGEEVTYQYDALQRLSHAETVGPL